MAVRREFVEDLYRNTLGRGDNFTPQEVEGWLGAGSEDAVRDAFLGSPEYTSAHGGTATWKNDAAGNIVPTGATLPTSPGFDIIGDGGGVHGYSAPPNGSASVNNAPYTGFTPRYDYSAFNTGRQQDPGKSAKDAFAMLSNDAPPPPFASKAEMANWFNANIRPGMDALGHTVTSVNEDGFTYTNHEGTFFVDFSQNTGAAPGTMLQRLQWNATPADDATRKRYATTGGGGTGAGGAGGGGSMNDLGSLLSRLGALGGAYGGPGGPGITNGPLQQVGQDPFSQLMTGGLVDFLGRGGRTALGDDVEGVLKSLVASGGRSTGPVRRALASGGGDVGGDAVEGIGPDVSGFGSGDIVAQRFESARELMEKARRTALESARGDLANRNLLSEPGIPQGAEIGAIRRINENLGADFAREMRDITSDEFERADTRLTSALGLMTGMAEDEAKTFLAGIGEGTARQSMLADLALRSLQTNMAWNQFLAEFGLKRDQTLQMLQQGRVDDVMGLLNSFLTLASLSRGGYI